MSEKTNVSFLKNVELIDVANLIKIDLGVTIDMVDHHLKLIHSLEQARRGIYIASSKEKIDIPEKELVLEPDDVNSILQDLLSLSKDDDDEQIDMLMGEVPGGIRGGLRTNNASFEAVAVKTTVKTVLRRKKKKENQ